MKIKKTYISLITICLGLILGCTKKSDDSSDTNSIPIDKTANLLTAGASANDILSNSKFTKMKVEIAYVAGFRPANETMVNFVDFIRAHTFKTDIELVYTELTSPDKESLTIQEIADLESENRTVYNNGETLGVYIYFADAPAADDSDDEEGLSTLGAVYRNTTMVIHESVIREFASRSIFVSNADIEIATINHEFGHLFGLVNLGTEMVNDHEDPDAKNHCSVGGCLMRAELQFGGSNKTIPSSVEGLHSSCSLNGTSVLKLLETSRLKGNVNSVPLDSECVSDLQANGGR